MNPRSMRLLPLAACAILAAACHDAGSGGGPDMSPPPSGPGWSGTLDVEIRDSASVTIADPGTGAIDVTLQFKSNGYQPIDPALVLHAPGRIEHFPEGNRDLYVARFSAPAQSKSPCGDKPLSLALSLARREGADRVGGSLAIYCGDQTFTGTPARIVRLTGQLPRNP
jgi:hypothetical protein